MSQDLKMLEGFDLKKKKNLCFLDPRGVKWVVLGGHNWVEYIKLIYPLKPI